MAPPADQLIEPAPARRATTSRAAQIERGQDFRRPQVVHRAGGAGDAVRAARGTRGAAAGAAAARGRRWWHGALAGAAIAVAQSVVVLPFTIVNRIRAIDVGLNTRSWLGWAWDWVLSVSINAVLMGLLAVALLWLMRRLPRWLVGAGRGGGGRRRGRLDPAQPGRARPAVQPLRAAAGASRCAARCWRSRARPASTLSEVQVMDASRRTTGANAYVAGLGHTKRIVLYDNLLATSRAPSSSTSSPTSSATSTTATCAAGCSTSRSWRRSGCSRWRCSRAG